MIAYIGFGVLVIAFLVTVYSVIAAIYGERTKNAAFVESARRAMLLTWPLLTLARRDPDLSAGQQPLRGTVRLRSNQPQHAHLPEGDCLVGRTSRFAAVLVLADVGVRLAGHLAQMGP